MGQPETRRINKSLNDDSSIGGTFRPSLVNNMEDMLKCDVCGTTKKLQRCGFCKRAFYCSRDHQMKDWKRHKAVCKTCVSTSANTSNGSCKENLSAIQRHGEISTINHKKSEEQDESIKTDTNVKLKNNISTDNQEGVPFDDRPYRPCKALILQPNMGFEELGKTAVHHLVQDGFCIIDNFFSTADVENAVNDIHKCDRNNLFYSGHLAGGRTGDDVDKQVVNSGIRSDKILWVEGNEDFIPGISKIVSYMDEILGTFNSYLDGKYLINKRTKAMIACYPGNGSYYKRHIDNPNSDGRIVTCILYLNKDWNVEENGGFLRILPVDTDAYYDVAPQANRLLFFWSDRRTPHEVHPAYRTRYAITVWYMDKIEREKAKKENEESGISPENRPVDDLELSKTAKEDVDKQIENIVSSAVSSLSIDELQAFAALIKDQPNPREILSGMGISPAIQDKLLEKLSAT